MIQIPERIVEVKVGPPGGTGRTWRDLYVRCRGTKTTGRSPNKAKVTLYNLSDDSRQWLERPGQVIQILAGEDVAGQAFFGDITKRSVKSSRQGPDLVTEIEAADGRRIFQASRFVASYPAQTTRDEILSDLLAAMGLARGYIDPSIPARVYPTAPAFAALGRQVMSELWAPDEAVWSIQAGALQVLAKGKPAQRSPIVVSAQTGMIGEPKITDKGIEVLMDFNGEVNPGAILSMVSDKVKGGYRVTKVDFDIDTFGELWETKAIAVLY